MIEATDSPSLASRSMSRATWLVLLLIFSIGLGARTFKLSSDNFWHDEICSMEYACGNGAIHYVLPTDRIIEPGLLTARAHATDTWRVWGSLKQDHHPPLYFLLLRIWMNVFGWSNNTATLLSVTLSMAAMAVFFDLVRRLDGTEAALWATTVFALAGFQLEYARDVRAYVMLMLFTLLAAHAVVRIEQQGYRWHRGAVLALSVWAACLSHYFAAFALPAVGVYALLRLRGRILMLTLGAFTAAGVLLAITWLPFFLQQRHSVSNFTAWMVPADTSVVYLLKKFLLLPSRFIGPSSHLVVPDAPFPLQTIAGVVFFVPLFFLRRRPSWWLWTLLLWIPTGSLLLLDLLKGWEQVNYPRYAIAAAPGLYAIVCTIPARAWITYALRGIAVFTALSSFAYSVWPYVEPDMDWQGGGQYLDQHAGKDDVICYAGPAEMISALNNPKAMLLCFGHYFETARKAVILTKPASPELDAQLRRQKQLWLATFGREPETMLPGWKVVQSKGTRSVSAGMIYRLEPAPQTGNR